MDSHSIALSMLLVFGAAKLMAELFEALGQPGIVGEILAGFLLGPAVLNWISPNELLTLLSDLGVMFLLFQVGLEVKASELRKVGATALLVAVLGVVLPFLCGWGIMSWSGAPTVECVFVGAAMVATSVGITARVLSEKGLLEQTASQIILAAAVFDDVLGLLVLAFVSSLARGSVNVAGLVTTAALAIGFTVLVAVFGTRAAGRVIPPLALRLRSGEARFNLALVALFGLAALAAWTGIAAIVGAFLAGMALAETVDRRVHDMANGISELLLPFFLAGIGLHLDLTALREPATALLCGLILVAAVLSKMVGCGLGAASLGRAGMFQVGVGMIPRGEVGMVVAQMGLSLHVIPPPVYGVVVVMAVATTMIAPPLIQLAYRNVTPGAREERFGLG